jgi:hypothetical protein
VDRLIEARRVASELLDDIELDRIPLPQCLMKGRRLARLMEDEEVSKWISYELTGYKKDDLGLKYMDLTSRWGDATREKGYWGSIPELLSNAESYQAAIQAHRVESISGDNAFISLRAQNAEINTKLNMISATSRIPPAVLTVLHDYVGRVYLELIFSEQQANIFESLRKEVDARLSEAIGDSLLKIQSIQDRLNAGDSEAVSQAMLTCRRLIDAFANCVFPARNEEYSLGGQKLAVKQSNVLNRMNAYVHSCGVTGGRAVRIRRTLADVYERVSSGVHADVSYSEARFLFLNTYTLLGEIFSLDIPVTSGAE